MFDAHTILVSPLDWGLGHAVRVIPIIRRFISEGRRVILGGSGESLKLLRAEFPELQSVELPSFHIEYSAGRSQVWAMLRQIPKIIRGSIKEHKAIKKIVRELGVDCVVSDNRFGLYGSGSYSVYITHQLMVKMPCGLKWSEGIGYRVHKKIIERYDECWVPDYEDAVESLAGDLTHKYAPPSNAKYIGPISRFSDMVSAYSPVACDVLVILSGVEPQRTIFEQSILKRYRDSNQRVVLVRGKWASAVKDYGNIEVYNALTADKLLPLILGADKIVCRCGYTTVMDMYLLKKSNVEWSATPGQTEQEYLLTLLTK